MKKKLTIFVLLLPLLVLLGLSNMLIDKSNDPNKELSKQYLGSKGYKIISYEGSNSYILKREMLTVNPYMMDWSVQNVDPQDYIGKTIHVEKFIVNNHPLERISYEGKTVVSVLISENKVFGGTAFPVTKEPLRGWVYSVDGKTLEEVQNVKSFEEWEDRWMKKFGSSN